MNILKSVASAIAIVIAGAAYAEHGTPEEEANIADMETLVYASALVNSDCGELNQFNFDRAFLNTVEEFARLNDLENEEAYWYLFDLAYEIEAEVIESIALEGCRQNNLGWTLWPKETSFDRFEIYSYDPETLKQSL